MAKSNTKKLKKKVSNYDDRLIKIIAISLAVVVAAIVTIVCVGAYSDSYVFKVDGNRVMDYEYEYFLGITMEEMQEDAEDTKAFWTDEKKAEAVNKAIEDAREWKAEYILSKKAGFGMSKKSAANLTRILRAIYIIHGIFNIGAITARLIRSFPYIWETCLCRIIRILPLRTTAFRSTELPCRRDIILRMKRLERNMIRTGIHTEELS